MNKLLSLIAILGMSIAISSCKKQDLSLPISIENLQGEWKHEYFVVPDFTMPPEYEYIHIKNDSFYMHLKWRSELLTTECPYDMGIAYIKGKVKLENGTLIFNGVYTTPEYEINTDSTGCFKVGEWNNSFKITSIQDESIHMTWLIPITNLRDHEKYVNLNRIN